MRNTETLINSVCNFALFADVAFLGYSSTTQNGLETRKVKKNPLPCSNSERRVSFDKVTKELC